MRIARTLCLLLPLILIPVPAPTVPAVQAGRYEGTISITATVDHTLNDSTGREEYHLAIRQSTGRLWMRIDKSGAVFFGFTIPVKYTYKDWAEVPDDGQGNCRGQRTGATGHGKIAGFAGNKKFDVSVGFTTIGPLRFRVGGFGANIGRIGSNCTKEVDGWALRDAMENGFHNAFSQSLRFVTTRTGVRSLEGSCTSESFQADAEASFFCSWRLHRVAGK